jgi:hypothetical protein
MPRHAVKTANRRLLFQPAGVSENLTRAVAAVILFVVESAWFLAEFA